MRPIGVHHVAIKVRDLAACERFYTDTLGLDVIRRQPHSVWLDLGGNAILMLETASGTFAGEGGLHLLALRISKRDREAWTIRLKVEGQTRYTLYIRDPEGNRIGLSHFPDPID